jgi:putative spermidine/putrescine transport system substrate-binding protein
MFRAPSRRTALVAAASVAAVLGVAACSAPSSSSSSSTSASGGAANAATATSAQALGGMDALVAAAKKEGTLNVIALPPDWANYGQAIAAFGSKYGIKVNSAQPDASSADEIAAATRLKGQPTAPDVFDLGQAVANANTSMFAPYQVATWSTIPADRKDSNGVWVNDYAGYMSVGYDSAKVPAPTSMNDLLKPAYKGKVALNGNPTQAGAAFAGVQMVSLAEGGSAGDITKGVDFFKNLKKAGNFLPVDPTPATIQSGQTPVVFDWAYNNAPISKTLTTWKTWIPDNAVLAAYYVQAISKDAPHPAAARLWEEFLFSDEGQNYWLKGAAFPVRYDAMKTAGTLDADALKALPPVTGTPVIPTDADNNTAKDYLTKNWANAVG